MCLLSNTTFVVGTLIESKKQPHLHESKESSIDSTVSSSFVSTVLHSIPSTTIDDTSSANMDQDDLLSVENSVRYEDWSGMDDDKHMGHDSFLEEDEGDNTTTLMESSSRPPTTSTAPSTSNNNEHDATNVTTMGDTSFYEHNTSPTDIMDMDPHNPHELDDPTQPPEPSSIARAEQNVEDHGAGDHNSRNNNMISRSASTTTMDNESPNGNEEETKDLSPPEQEESEYEVIARDVAFVLDKKLENARAWTKKLLREITVYVKTLEEVQKEYTRVQQLEHQESNRLDQVEPEVQGATSHYPLFEGGQQELHANEMVVPGNKRKNII